MRIIRTGTISPRRSNTTKKMRHECLISVGSFAPIGVASLSRVLSPFYSIIFKPSRYQCFHAVGLQFMQIASYMDCKNTAVSYLETLLIIWLVGAFAEEYKITSQVLHVSTLSLQTNWHNSNSRSFHRLSFNLTAKSVCLPVLTELVLSPLL
jgi:hypothetical protein